MDKVYHLSNFCHFVEIEKGVAALYNSLNLGVIFLQKEIADIFQNAIGGVIKETDLPLLSTDNRNTLFNSLTERRLIMSIDKMADLDDYIKIQNLLKENGIGILYLLTTDGCNLGCHYCYIENILPKNYKFSYMTEETAKEGVDLFVRSLSKTIEEPQIIFYGGEPLMNLKVVIWAINYICELKKQKILPAKTNITINTNGTLLSPEFINFLVEKGIQIAVSLDGPREIHNMMRQYKNGNGTYDKVIHNCQMITKLGGNLGFSVTITKANIHQLEDILLWLHQTFNINSIGFNIVIDRNKDVIGMTEKEYAQLVTQKLINCFEICREKGIYEDRMMRKVNSFVKGYPYIYDCGAPGDQLVISPDRMVGVCQAYCGSKKYFVPLDEIGNPINHPIWQEWKFRSPLHQKQCYSCIAIGICGGGCLYNAELTTGTIWGLDETFCIHSQGTVNYLIKKLYKQTQTA